MGASAIAEVLSQWGSDLGHRDPRGMTPLAYAAEAGHAVTCEKLIALGAKANGAQNADARGYLPLHYGAANGHAGVVQALVDSGCDVNPRTLDGRPAPPCVPSHKTSRTAASGPTAKHTRPTAKHTRHTHPHCACALPHDATRSITVEPYVYVSKPAPVHGSPVHDSSRDLTSSAPPQPRPLPACSCPCSVRQGGLRCTLRLGVGTWRPC